MLGPQRESRWRTAPLLALAVLLPACTNSPYRAGDLAGNACFTFYDAPPTHLDPATAYYQRESHIIDNVYEPPFAYHYLRRPYELQPLTAEALPRPAYFSPDGQPLTAADPDAAAVGRVTYTIRLRADIAYQPHPCFARDAAGRLLYTNVAPSALAGCDYPSRFPHQGTRLVTAQDYALQIRRLADPRTQCPVYSTLKTYILGFEELNAHYTRTLDAERARRRAAAGAAYNQDLSERRTPIALDYGAVPFPGVEVVDDRTYRVVLKRKYPQFLYWMALHFFAPVPEEALRFYAQPALRERQFSLDRCPVGSGAYYLDAYEPNTRIVLRRNPHFHADRYPDDGAPGDREAGLLADAGRTLPFIERIVLTLEKESIPAWNKFLQGYYDDTGIVADVYDQAIRGGGPGDATLSDDMAARGIRLVTDIESSFWHLRFNMLDDTVGGGTPARRALRQALTIALDSSAYLDIFLNGRGVPAAGPLPPGVFGYRAGPEGVNACVDRWDPARGGPARLPLDHARALMSAAGYPGGRAPDGAPLTLYLDHAFSGDAAFRSQFAWMQQSLGALGVRLRERPTDLSRFRAKLDQGNWQLARGNWLADYPDPENFLFLFYGPNGRARHRGANATNYDNPAFDAVFTQLEALENGPARQALIDQAVRLLQADAPAVWQYFPVSYTQHHEWYRNVKPHQMSHNTFKYRRVDAARRTARVHAWNRPHYGPVLGLLSLLALGMLPAVSALRRRERGGADREPRRTEPDAMGAG